MLSFAIVSFIASAISIAALPLEIRQSSTSAYCSDYNGTYKLSAITAPARGAGTQPSGTTAWGLVLNDTAAAYRQNITGFGAAVTDSTVVTFNRMSSTNQNSLINTLMTTSGANFSLMRHTIGGSDMSATNYTYDDNNNQPDPNLANFTLGTNGTAMASVLAKMRKAQPGMTLLGSSWSAPGWMKRNKALTGNAKNNNLQDTYLNSSETDYSYAFANYFVKYIQAYQNAGAPVNAITLQNEPLNSVAGFPTMYVYDYENALLIKNRLGPAFAQAGLTTQIWAYDHNTDKPSYPQTILDHAGQYVNTVAWHCYSGTSGWDVLSSFKANNTNVIQYMTECWTPSTPPWYNAAAFTMGPLQNWASGAMAWNLAADVNNGPHIYNGCAHCTGLVTINNDGSYTLNTAYYMMAQFSKFMPGGARVLPVAGGGSISNGQAVQSVGSINPDGTRTVVFLSTVTNSVYMTLNTTSGQTWSGTIPPQSVVTWILPKIS
ncbi:glycoside hydrolase family 30 protein [Pseudocercospora fijiensis CIRAD86]|uniref:glucan endo-1,6-beta-glucosidase n=1 Tax=Pseudocercospora fijiensis (strain CIRAD86) TaxID=383855 RepID=M2Z992_PSEFD|nr:glycoside hydrolase family 30 protein [Pseudocercospora fijiensis CIRAD86]EME86370.1 glycoside hydrolase family 30 protein [Pseudocercospora fijiensis CIRAD86]